MNPIDDRGGLNLFKRHNLIKKEIGTKGGGGDGIRPKEIKKHFCTKKLSIFNPFLKCYFHLLIGNFRGVSMSDFYWFGLPVNLAPCLGSFLNEKSNQKMS